jgi:formate hydrogenlyase subunit 3/multisubunit Na+/H+ antiporter MnhD subunit
MKITLFLCAGSILVASGKENISEMAGIGRAMPITMFAFTVGALGMCGTPPIAGFISKWFFSLGAIQSGQIAFLVVILIASLLDVVYFFPVIRTAFFGKMPEIETLSGDREEKVGVLSEQVQTREGKRPIYLFMVIPLAITAFFSILFCLFPRTFHLYDLAQMAVRDIFGGM